MSQVITMLTLAVLALVGWLSYVAAWFNIRRLRAKLAAGKPTTEAQPAKPHGIDCGGISAEDVEVLRRNHMHLTDDERDALDAAFVEALRQFDGPVPHIPGPYDITEGEEQ